MGRLAVEDGDRHFHRDDFVVEVPGGLGFQRLLVAVQRELVRLLPGDAELLPQALRGDSHPHVKLRQIIDDPGIRRELVPGHRDHAHRLGPAGDNDLRAASADAIGRERDRLQARRAEAVDGDRGHCIRQPGPEHDGPGHVHAGFALGKRAPEDQVVDFAGRHLRKLLHQRLYHGAGQIVRPGIA